MLPFRKKKITVITSQGVLLLMGENKLAPNSIFFLTEAELSFQENTTEPNVNEIDFFDIKETDLVAYRQDMIVCYTHESLHLRLRSHHIPGCNLDISVYDSVFRHRRFWSMLTMHPRNPNLHNLIINIRGNYSFIGNSIN